MNIKWVYNNFSGVIVMDSKKHTIPSTSTTILNTFLPVYKKRYLQKPAYQSTFVRRASISAQLQSSTKQLTAVQGTCIEDSGLSGDTCRHKRHFLGKPFSCLGEKDCIDEL